MTLSLLGLFVKDPRCYNVIDEAWKNEFYGSDSFILCRKQFSTTATLKKWNKETFGFCQTRMKELSTKLEQVQAGSVSEKNLLMKASIQRELNSWLSNNESFWKQKSREVWLKEGDKNSKFFHLFTIIRRRRNAIDTIKGNDGVWITNKAKIRNHIVSKFQSLYTFEPVSFPPDLDDLILPCITQSENADLCLIPSPLEIKESLFGMQNLKSPGPDGLPALFYKQYWPIVGNNVIKVVQNFFISGQMLSEVNQSLIVLIPKNQSPTNVNHFRPISLCNTV